MSDMPDQLFVYNRSGRYETKESPIIVGCVSYTRTDLHQSALAERDKRIEALEGALRLVLPLAKGYAPEKQTLQARKTCQNWIKQAEAALQGDEGGK